MKRTETKSVKLRGIVPLSVIVSILLFVLPFMETKIMNWYAKQSYDHDMKLTINLSKQSDEFDGFGCSSAWWSQIAGNGENAEEIANILGYSLLLLLHKLQFHLMFLYSSLNQQLTLF